MGYHTVIITMSWARSLMLSSRHNLHDINNNNNTNKDMYLQQRRTGDLFLDEEKALNTASKKLHFSNSKKG